MNLKHYVATDNDLLGYNVSFQNLLEGYGFADGKPTSTMHNLVSIIVIIFFVVVHFLDC